MASIFDADPIIAPPPGGEPTAAAVPPLGTPMAPPAPGIFAGDPIVTPTQPAAPPPALDVPTSAPHKFEVGLSGLARGGAELAGMPGDLARLASLGHWSPSWLPTSPQAVDWLGRETTSLGMPLATPQNEAERFINAAAEGAGSTLPLGFIPGGQVSLLARLGLAGVQGAAMGAGGEAGRELLPNAPMVGTLAGGLAGGGVAGAALGGAGRLAGLLAGTSADPISAYRALDITPRLAGDVTQSPVLQAVQATAARLPGGGRVERAAEATRGEFGNAVERTAASLDPAAGPVTTLQEAGDVLQDHARQWLDRSRAGQQNAWDAVNAKISDTAPVDMTGVDTALRSGMAQMPNMPETAAAMSVSPVFDRLATGLANDIAARGGAGGFTAPWADVRAWQQRVGDNLQGALVAGDPAAAQWKQLYGALSDATGQAATAHGAAAEYTAAKDLTASDHNFIDTVLNRVISSKNPGQNTISPEAAANFVLGGAVRGGSVLQAIRDEMPDAADALAAYRLRSMAVPVPGQALGDAVSPNSFLTRYNQTAPEARAALFPDPQTAQDLENLKAVAQSMRGTMQRLANPSGTAGALAHAGPAVGAVTGAAEGANYGYQEGGVPGAVKGALVGALSGGTLPFVPGYVLGNVVARPSLTQLLSQPSLVPRTPWVGSPWALGLGGRAGRAAVATAPPLAFYVAGQQPP